MGKFQKARYGLSALAGLSIIGTLTACDPTGAVPVHVGSQNVDTSAEYTNGTYSAEGQYVSPGAIETIGVELVLEDDVVTEVSIVEFGESPNATRFQSEFARNIDGQVVGIDIDRLYVNRVSGSSLTNDGFDEAIKKIKAEALQ